MTDFVRPVDQTILTEWTGLFLVLAFVFLIGGLASASRLPSAVKALVWLALGLRVVGAGARFLVLQNYYGAGDATGYFGKGWLFADSFRRLDFAPLTQGGAWYGTEFVRSVSGAVLFFIGPAMFAEFVVFALFSFAGLVGFAYAFRRAYPTAPMSRYLVWIWVFPSLWFWPSSIGKEALLLMGLGMAVMGFVGRGRRINWPFFIAGLVLMFGVRPQVAAVFFVAVIASQWFSFEGRWTGRKLMQAVFLLVIGLIFISYAMRSVGLEDFDVEGIQEYVEGDKAREITRGTSVGVVNPGLKGIPMAVFNVLARPLPWEASNPLVLISSLEVLSLWTIVFLRRRNLARSLRYWRSDRMLRLSIAFVLMYSASLGMMLFNVGIIARQRIFLFPFLFLLLEAEPLAAVKAAAGRVKLERMASPVLRRFTAGRRAPFPASEEGKS